MRRFAADAVRSVMLSVIGAVYMFLAVLLLMTARWMQALLFNPGGFRTEFHGLRIERHVALGLIAAALPLVPGRLFRKPGRYIF